MAYTPESQREGAFDVGLTCEYCGVRTLKPIGAGKMPPQAYARQHILPKRRGGRSGRENLRDCCYACNQMLSRVDDCPGAMACWMAIAIAIGLPGTANGAKGAHRRWFKKAGGTNYRKRRRKARRRKLRARRTLEENAK